MATTARVLLIDDDPGTLDGFAGVLRLSGFDVLTAPTGLEAVLLAERKRPDLVLAELHLPDLPGLEIVRQLRAKGITVPFIVVTGFGTARSAVDAMRLGALDYIEKPLVGDQLVDVVERGLARHDRAGAVLRGCPRPEAPAARRWANAVARALMSPADPKTLYAWGHCVGASPGALKNWCRTAGVSPRRSLLLARLLRVVVLRNAYGCQAEDLLDVADPRTLSRLLRLGGAETGSSRDLPHDGQTFLARQTLIRNPVALRELESALNESTSCRQQR